MLLTATWPNDDPVPKKILNEIVKHSIPAFKFSKVMEFLKYFLSYFSNIISIQIIIHTIWLPTSYGAKCVSRIGVQRSNRYTSFIQLQENVLTMRAQSSLKLYGIIVPVMSHAKYLYIYYIYLYLISLRHSNISILSTLSRKRYPKYPDYRYFDARLAGDVNEGGIPFQQFLLSYSTFVTSRIKYFSPKWVFSVFAFGIYHSIAFVFIIILLELYRYSELSSYFIESSPQTKLKKTSSISDTKSATKLKNITEASSLLRESRLLVLRGYVYRDVYMLDIY